MRGGPEIDELVEDVSDVGLRVDVVELARLNQRSDTGPVFSPLVMPGEQRILAIEHERPDTALDNVRVKFDAAIVQEADETLPMIQAVAEFLGDPDLAETRAS